MKKTLGIVAALGLLAAGYRKKRGSRVPRPESRAGGMTVIRSRNDFETTVERLLLVLEDIDEISDIQLIDHVESALETSAQLAPTQLVLFTSAELASILIETERTVALDLPFKFLVWQSEDADVWIGWNDPQHLAQRHGLESVADVLDAISELLEELATSAATD